MSAKNQKSYIEEAKSTIENVKSLFELYINYINDCLQNNDDDDFQVLTFDIFTQNNQNISQTVHPQNTNISILAGFMQEWSKNVETLEKFSSAFVQYLVGIIYIMKDVTSFRKHPKKYMSSNLINFKKLDQMINETPKEKWDVSLRQFFYHILKKEGADDYLFDDASYYTQKQEICKIKEAAQIMIILSETMEPHLSDYKLRKAEMLKNEMKAKRNKKTERRKALLRQASTINGKIENVVEGLPRSIPMQCMRVSRLPENFKYWEVLETATPEQALWLKEYSVGSIIEKMLYSLSHLDNDSIVNGSAATLFEANFDEKFVSNAPNFIRQSYMIAILLDYPIIAISLCEYYSMICGIFYMMRKNDSENYKQEIAEHRSCIIATLKEYLQKDLAQIFDHQKSNDIIKELNRFTSILLKDGSEKRKLVITSSIIRDKFIDDAIAKKSKPPNDSTHFANPENIDFKDPLQSLHSTCFAVSTLDDQKNIIDTLVVRPLHDYDSLDCDHYLINNKNKFILSLMEESKSAKINIENYQEICANSLSLKLESLLRKSGSKDIQFDFSNRLFISLYCEIRSVNQLSHNHNHDHILDPLPASLLHDFCAYSEKSSFDPQKLLSAELDRILIGDDARANATSLNRFDASFICEQICRNLLFQKISSISMIAKMLVEYFSLRASRKSNPILVENVANQSRELLDNLIEKYGSAEIDHTEECNVFKAFRIFKQMNHIIEARYLGKICLSCIQHYLMTKTRRLSACRLLVMTRFAEFCEILKNRKTTPHIFFKVGYSNESKTRLNLSCVALQTESDDRTLITPALAIEKANRRLSQKIEDTFNTFNETLPSLDVIFSIDSAKRGLLQIRKKQVIRESLFDKFVAAFQFCDKTHQVNVSIVSLLCEFYLRTFINKKSDYEKVSEKLLSLLLIYTKKSKSNFLKFKKILVNDVRANIDVITTCIENIILQIKLDVGNGQDRVQGYSIYRAMEKYASECSDSKERESHSKQQPRFLLIYLMIQKDPHVSDVFHDFFFRHFGFNFEDYKKLLKCPLSENYTLMEKEKRKYEDAHHIASSSSSAQNKIIDTENIKFLQGVGSLPHSANAQELFKQKIIEKCVFISKSVYIANVIFGNDVSSKCKFIHSMCGNYFHVDIPLCYLNEDFDIAWTKNDMQNQLLNCKQFLYDFIELYESTLNMDDFFNVRKESLQKISPEKVSKQFPANSIDSNLRFSLEDHPQLFREKQLSSLFANVITSIMATKCLSSSPTDYITTISENLFSKLKLADPAKSETALSITDFFINKIDDICLLFEIFASHSGAQSKEIVPCDNPFHQKRSIFPRLLHWYDRGNVDRTKIYYAPPDDVMIDIMHKVFKMKQGFSNTLNSKQRKAISKFIANHSICAKNVDKEEISAQHFKMAIYLDYLQDYYPLERGKIYPVKK